MARRAVASALALALAGCGGGHGGEYWVTVTDGVAVSCVGVKLKPIVPTSQVTSAAHSIEQAIKTAFLLEPARPEGHILRVVEGADEMRAWFDGPAFQPNGIPSALSPTEVYVGAPHDDSIEGDSSDVFRLNVPPASGSENPADCGELLRSQGALRLTVDAEGIDGRIRRTEYSYLSGGISACDVRVECGRTLLVEGSLANE